MTGRRFLLLCLIMLSTLILITACTVTETITLAKNNSGSSQADVSIEPFFRDVLDDFSLLATAPGGPAAADPLDAFMESIAAGLGGSPASSHIKMVRTQERTYTITFDFSNLQSFLDSLAGQQAQDIVTLTSGNGTTSLAFSLSMATYPDLVHILPFLGDPNLEAYGPVYNHDLSEAEYLEMIGYVFGEEGPRAIKQSRIIVRLNLPAPITSHSGGRIIAPQVYEYSFPLIDFLLLHKPLACLITW